MKNECPWTRDVCEVLKRQNAMIYNLVASVYNEWGWPDRFIAHPYWSGFLEFKKETTAFKDGQQEKIRKLRACGNKVFVARRDGHKDRISIEDEERTRLFVTSPERLLRDLRAGGSMQPAGGLECDTC